MAAGFTQVACQYETSFCATMNLWFTGRALVFDHEMNVGFGPTKRPQIVGRPSPPPRATAARSKE